MQNNVFLGCLEGFWIIISANSVVSVKLRVQDSGLRVQDLKEALASPQGSGFRASL